MWWSWRDRKRFPQLLVYFSNICKSVGWAMLKSGVRRVAQGSSWLQGNKHRVTLCFLSSTLVQSWMGSLADLLQLSWGIPAEQAVPSLLHHNAGAAFTFLSKYYQIIIKCNLWNYHISLTCSLTVTFILIRISSLPVYCRNSYQHRCHTFFQYAVDFYWK